METSVGVGHEVTTFLTHGKALVRVWDFPLSRVWLWESEVGGKLHTVPRGLPVRRRESKSRALCDVIDAELAVILKGI